MPVDAHLMIEDPDSIAPKYAQVGCNSVSFHFEAAKNCHQIIADNGVAGLIAIPTFAPFDLISAIVWRQFLAASK